MRPLLIFILFSLIMPAFLIGQVNFVEHLVSGTIHGTASVYACDVDNDDDLDILGASYEEHTIDWWRNDGGNPIQWTRITIANNFIQAGSVFASDLDGDSLIDILGMARIGDQVAWWHNSGGDSITWTKYVIRNNYDLAHEVFACDLDQDGDMDVLGAASNDNEITWWRNDGDFPIQWTEQVIDLGFGGAKSVHVADFDGDSLLDIVGAAILDNEITWWRNNGGDPIQWTTYVISHNFYGAHRVEAIDIDKDGRVDVLGAGYWANAIAWWRNTEGNPVTWSKQTISYGVNGACIAQGVDLDGDTDIDVVGTAQAGNEVAWWRNDGGDPIVWTKFVIDNLPRAWPLYCCDLDQDSDIDVISASSWAGTNELKWYENQGTAITEIKTQILPPRVTSLIITGEIILPQGHSCRVFDANGRVVSSPGLPSGIYYLEVDGMIQTRIVKL